MTAVFLILKSNGVHTNKKLCKSYITCCAQFPFYIQPKVERNFILGLRTFVKEQAYVADRIRGYLIVAQIKKFQLIRVEKVNVITNNK